MSRTRFALALLLALPALGPAGAAPFVRKPKVDAANARALVETLKNSTDEKKRKAAADELGGADPRVSPDAAPALIAALRTDTSAAVRYEAADALRRLDEISPQAGVALEAAVEGDASPLVRLAAKRALWEYHLKGYQAPKNVNEFAAETAEPPLASPSGPRPAVLLVPATPVVALQLPPVARGAAPELPPVVAPPVPASRMFWPNVLPRPRAAIRDALNLGPPPLVNLTREPPLTDKPYAPPVTVEPPKASPEPPLRLPPPTEYARTLPPFEPYLPPIVTPPGTLPRK